MLSSVVTCNRWSVLSFENQVIVREKHDIRYRSLYHRNLDWDRKRRRDTAHGNYQPRLARFGIRCRGLYSGSVLAFER